MCERFEIGGMAGIVCTSGPTYEFVVQGKKYYYALPKYCGLVILNHDGSERQTRWPRRVWAVIDLAMKLKGAVLEAEI